MGLKRLNYYEIEEVLACPYCGDAPKGDEYGCCGESSAHFETVILHNDETYQIDEVELYRPIADMIRFEILNKWVWLGRKRRFKSRIRKLFVSLYDKGLVLKLRQVTGFQWTKLDCFILRQMHQFPLYYTPPSQIETKERSYVLIPDSEK